MERKNVLVGLPVDVASDLDAVCRHGERTLFIVDAIREKLAGEPIAQRARDERAAAIEAATGVRELTPEEGAQWWYEVDKRITETVRRELAAGLIPPMRRIRNVLGDAVITDEDES